MSDLVAMDAKLLLVARRFTGIRCAIAPIKFALSPGKHCMLVGTQPSQLHLGFARFTGQKPCNVQWPAEIAADGQSPPECPAS